MFASQQSTCALSQSPSSTASLPRRAGRQQRRTLVVGQYALGRKLGEGGMGEVYLAEHCLLGRRCAVKLIRAEQAGDSSAIARFQTEVQALARLSHRNTVAIFDCGVSAEGDHYYAMEYVSGRNLQEIVNRFGPLPPQRVVHLLLQVCAALGEAHQLRLIHRDVKPANIMVTECGGGYEVAKLLDFGLAKFCNDEHDNSSQTPVFVGSPLYASPESSTDCGCVDARSDIYSLGATAYFLLTGRPVFQRDHALSAIAAHATATPIPPSQVHAGIPAELEALIMKCLAKNPADRFDDARQLDAALAQIDLEPDVELGLSPVALTRRHGDIRSDYVCAPRAAVSMESRVQSAASSRSNPLLPAGFHDGEPRCRQREAATKSFADEKSLLGQLRQGLAESLQVGAGKAEHFARRHPVFTKDIEHQLLGGRQRGMHAGRRARRHRFASRGFRSSLLRHVGHCLLSW
jgi:serine/threonine protein kinase